MTDVAAFGTASQTTSHSSGLYPASHAIDGDFDTFNHTDSDSANNAWELTFDAPMPLARIEVKMRNCCDGRLDGGVLRLYDELGKSIYSTPFIDGGAWTVFIAELPADLAVKKVRIGFENGVVGIVHLAEVWAYIDDAIRPDIEFFDASPSSITNGEASVLSWSVTGVDTIIISGLPGTFDPVGTTNVTPVESMPYILSATNDCATRTATATVIVDGKRIQPRISEFMAYPAEGSDWIEIWNPGIETVNLEGYYLSDDPSNPKLWPFPSVNLPSGELIVLGAGESYAGSALFTSFALSRDSGSYLGLYAPDGTLIDSWTYPEQSRLFSYGISASSERRYFAVPSPGDLNTAEGSKGILPEVIFSIPRGFFTFSFNVELSCPDPQATIYYTTDSSSPAPDNPSAIVFQENTSFLVTSTTVVRARSFREDYTPSPIVANSYLFLAEVIQQPEYPPNFPEKWMLDSAEGGMVPIPRRSDYEMDPRIVDAAPYTDRDGESFNMVDALLAIPTMLLSMPTEEMFDETNGLHTNAELRGEEWEREISLEMIIPETGQNGQAPCGLRMHGGRNRIEEMLKKSFRIYFRSDYGAPRFDFPVFEGKPENGFDELVLRSGNGKTWASPWRDLYDLSANSLPRVTYLRDQLARDCQHDLGHPHFGGDFVHLYINGLYWGLYNVVDRPAGDYAAALYGGDEEDYDFLKWTKQLPPDPLSGDTVAWAELMTLTRGDVDAPAVNARIEELLDLRAYAEYMIINFYLGNSDWIGNNTYAMRKRDGGRFYFLCWDSEECLLDLDTNKTGVTGSDNCAELYQNLRSSTHFKRIFADAAYDLLSGDGPLAPANGLARHNALVTRIDRAIVAESARWGDVMRPDDPYTREDEWLAEVARINDQYMMQRPQTTINQLLSKDLYSTLAAPSISPQIGGHVEEDFLFRFTSEDADSFIHYTVDGRDPCMPDGSIASNAYTVSVNGDQVNITTTGDSWKYLDTGIELGSSAIVEGHIDYNSTNWKHSDFNDSTWNSGPSPLGYGDLAGMTPTTPVGYGGDASSKFTTTYFRRSFTAADIDELDSLKLYLLVDDGAIAYLNGREVARLTSMPDGAVFSSTFATGSGDEDRYWEFMLPLSDLREGSNQLAVEVHQKTLTSSDIVLDARLLGTRTTVGNGFSLPGDANICARAKFGTEWSPAFNTFFIVGDPGSDLVVSELMYQPGNGRPADAEFLELLNKGTLRRELSDLYINGGIRFDFTESPVTALWPGERLLLARDEQTFSNYYPSTSCTGEYEGKLSNDGEQFTLWRDNEDTPLWTFSYGAFLPCAVSTSGGGYSMTRKPDGSWRPSVNDGGSPGTDDSSVLSGDLLSYALAIPTCESLQQQKKAGMLFSCLVNLNADQADIIPESSTDLVNWTDTDLIETSLEAIGDGQARKTWWYTQDTNSAPVFMRLRIRSTAP